MSGTNDKSYDAQGMTKGETLCGQFWTPPLDPAKYDDILKRSLCEGFTVTDAFIPGGRENAVDFVRGKSYRILKCVLGIAGYGAATIKGSIDGWTVEESVVKNGRKFGLEIGQFDNYWYPGRKPTRGGKIIRSSTGGADPIKVVLWDAERPEVIDSKVKVVKYPWLVWFPYFCIRALVVRAQGLPTK